MLICTIDFYHFAPVKVTITLAVGHKVSTKQNNYVTIIFCEEGEMVLKQFHWNILILLLNEIM